MNNIQKLVNSTARQDYPTFQKILNVELANRIADRINNVKKNIASNLFTEDKDTINKSRCSEHKGTASKKDCVVCNPPKQKSEEE